MNRLTFGTLTSGCVLLALVGPPAVAQTVKDKTKDKSKDGPPVTVKSGGNLPPAELTRTVLLKTKVSGTFENLRLGEVLKDLADQVDQKADQPVMWVYGKGFPYDKLVTYSCTEKPLDAVLAQLLPKAGETLGYVVVSSEGDKYDGWVRLTTTGERGTEAAARPGGAADDEASAAEKLKLAKKLIDLGKPAAARPVLEVLVKNYAHTKAGAEAKDLLEKIDK